jgi:leader peptidase (prepilin peptidase)/N-methyltransferase
VAPDLPAGFEIVVAALLGAMIGSFLNVCILRWGSEPKQSVVSPRSRCPRCGKGLAWYDNIPVISWLLLRARCRDCGEPISVQYPLIELATAGIWAYMAWRHGIALETLRGAIFGTILLGIAMTDAREYIIPHEFSIGGTLVGLALSTWPDPSQTLVSLQGALAGAGAVLLIGELSGLALGQEAMGGGDCALMGMIGAFLGWEAIFPVLLVGALISTVLFLLAAIWSRTARSTPWEMEPELPQAPGNFRWGLVARLFAVGALPILVIAASVGFGLVGEILSALFYGLLGAGLAYYASFLLPASVCDRWWTRVIGLVAAAVAMAVGGGGSAAGLVLGLVICIAVLWQARRGELVASPATTQALHSQGYLPFGVGLALAAGVLLFSGAMPLVREVVMEYSRFLRLA